MTDAMHGREVLRGLRSARVVSVRVRVSSNGTRASVYAWFSTAAGSVPERRIAVEPGNDHVLRALDVPREYRALSAPAQAEARRLTDELLQMLSRDAGYSRYRETKALAAHRRNLARRAEDLARDAVQQLGMTPDQVAAVVAERARHHTVRHVMET